MRVDFYILGTASKDQQFRFACRLVEKAYGLKHSVYAHVQNEHDAETLDELLWTFRDGSFVPHTRCSDPAADRTPVLIGSAEAAVKSGELLINLSNEWPACAAEFDRVAEVVDGAEAAVKAGRSRYKQYRELGVHPETHKFD